MGLIQAIKGAVGGGLADQWLEVIEADEMSASTVAAPGVTVRPQDNRNQNKKGSKDMVSNGSVIHVYDKQFMLLIDGGKVVDYTAEPGYYKVDNTAMPSLFHGEFGPALKETFRRVMFAGVPSSAQKVLFLNLQEVRDIPFGTTNAVNYFDNFYNAELYFRAHGFFSVQITEPLKFYSEVIDKSRPRMTADDFQALYLSEFLGEFQGALNKLSADGVRASHIVSKTAELTTYMREILDEDWNSLRGMQVQSVGLKSISYDEDSKKLIDIRNQGAMLQDAAIREGYVQGGVARGIEAAGSNEAGSMMGFMGVGMGMNAGGLSEMSRNNQAQIQQQAQQQAQATAPGWSCSCGANNAAESFFCPNCGERKPEKLIWNCSCGQQNEGNFCISCGKKRPEEQFCSSCGKKVSGESAKFCPHCGTAL